MQKFKLFKRVLIMFLITGLVSSGILGYLAYHKASEVVSTVASHGSVADLLKPEALNGESTGAVNVLIAGNSSDDAGHSGAELTDSLMVAHYDLTSKSLILISIPRDLYVQSGGSYMKINAVYETGGMDALESVVTEVTGLTINQEVLIDYSAFKDMIDAVGGVDVDIESSDPRGIYDPMTNFSISNGTHHLDGAMALALSRARNDPTYDGRIAYGLPNGDFDRTMYQQKIMQALLTKIESGQTLTSPTTLDKLINSLSGNVSSDFSVGQLRRVYDLSKQITSTKMINIRGGDGSLLQNYDSAAAGAALIPSSGVDDFTAIQDYINTTIDS